jgi:xanthine dehydrogenase accessory factor
METAGHDHIPETALDWHRAGRAAAIATVVETWGSAPRPRGAQLAIGQGAEMAGSVSGGCVEGAVVAEALDALQDGRPRLLEFGVSDDDAFAVGLACGGTIRVAVEPIGVGDGIPEPLLADLVAARAARRPVVLAVDPETWERRLVAPSDGFQSVASGESRQSVAPGDGRQSVAPGDGRQSVAPGDGEPLAEAAAAALRADRSGFADHWFLGVHNPPLRLAVVGAVHIAQALVPMARIAGYDVLVIDPREAFASPERFPDTRLSHDWADAALASFGLDTRTALVCLTHDPKLDDPALEAALAADPFYIGALGSTRTHAKRADRLAAAGHAPEAIARIHAPIGLAIGAASPAEIAVAILAQMTERLRRPETGPQATRPA